MSRKVVCAFPGVGKSYAARKFGWSDSDSSTYSWERPGVRHPNFPTNYIEHILETDGVVLVSSHKVVRDALASEEIPFYLVHPARECKAEYMQRYRDRGSDEAFIAVLDKNWDNWIDEMEAENRAANKFVLGEGLFLSDVRNVFQE